MFAADLKQKNCFVSCSDDKVKAGLCSCRIFIKSIIYTNFTREMRLLRLKEILKKLDKI